MILKSNKLTFLFGNNFLGIITVLFLGLISAILEIIGLSAIIPLISFSDNSLEILNISQYLQKYNIPTPFTEIKLTFEFFSTLVLIYFFVASLIKIAIYRYQLRFCHRRGGTIANALAKTLIIKLKSINENVSTKDVIADIWTKSNSVVYNCILPGVQILNGFTISFIIIALMLLINWQLVIISTTAFLLIYLLIINVLKTYSQDLGNSYNNSQNIAIKRLIDVFGFARDTKLQHGREHLLLQFDRPNREFRNTSGNIQLVASVPKYILEVLIVSVIFLTIFSVRSDFVQIDNLDLLFLSVCLVRFAPLAQLIYSNFAIIRASKPLVNNLYSYQLYSATYPHLTDPMRDNTNVRETDNQVLLKVNNITLKSKDSYLLRDFSFELRRKEWVGLVGPSGSGKSKLVDVVTNNITYDSGSVSYKGKIILPLDENDIMSGLACVPQSIYFSENSLIENVYPFKKLNEITDDDVQKLIFWMEQFGLSEILQSRTNGIFTLLGEDASFLSGGQKQRLGLIRAVVQNPELLIMDEATSALDDLTEDIVLSKLKAGMPNMSCLLISHNNNSRKYCDRLINMNNQMTKENLK